MATGKKLTRKNEEFVRQYLLDLNAAAAYRRAGYTARGNSAEVNAARLLRNAQVAEAIDKAMAERAARTEVSADRVLRELAKVAFFDPRKALKYDGSLRPLSEMDDDTAAAIASLDVVEIGGDESGVTRKVRLTDKLRALELIGKHLNMFRDRLEVAGLTPKTSIREDPKRICCISNIFLEA
ncbi:terminase small subunit [Methylocystis sp.]|uniref:terminase small subunit n=1 Tax=Methylocystis sp. TaxID=1911079 RepID=UPI0025F0804F|nr:terminase small subunit [Methylocystis sp.]